MKSITNIRSTRTISLESAAVQPFDPDAAFADPVGYLAGLGIDSQLVAHLSPTAVQEAA